MSTQLKIDRKTLLYKSNVKYADYAINHVEGCSHGCTYPCYAMMMKRRCGVVKTYENWLRPKLVGNTLELLDKELPKLKHKIVKVFLSFTTDPFMYGAEEVRELTLSILRRLKQDDVKAVTISKGVYPLCLAERSDFNRQNEYGTTIVSLSEAFRKKYEPGAAPVKERLNALRALQQSGLKTWVSIEPYPTPNIIKQDIREILDAVSFVDKIVFGRWNYSRQAGSFPYLTEFYRSMADEVIRFCEKHEIEVHIKEGTLRESPDLVVNKPLFQLPTPLSL